MEIKNFKTESKLILQNILKQKNISMPKLAVLINEYYGFEKYSANAVKMKISRGQYNIVFFLEVCEVLGVDIKFDIT